ncbi:MAG: PD-(D/E)XK nuclease family protein, partial [Bacteroidales bacterium]|nr:PD-(D/E)XK nuclease family protein [Bacteroidales bacterium]
MIEEIRKILSKTKNLNLKYEDTPFCVLPFMYNRISSKEILHSEIIASFLNHDSGHGCGDFFVTYFLELIGVSKSEYDTDQDFKVYTEYPIKNQRRIDILITWGKKAIIIENKLNNAIDQTDQLKDYYSIHSENKIDNDEVFNVLKVVYIPCNKTKKAPTNGLKKELIDKIVNFYPEDIINWLNKYPDNEVVKEACINYSKVLQYINVKNQNFMNAQILKTQLNNEELKKILNLVKIINSEDWNLVVLSEIQDKLKDTNIKFKEKEKRYLEIYYDNHSFWLELFFYKDKGCFGMWIADKSDVNKINPKITNLGFKDDGTQRGICVNLTQ